MSGQRKIIHASCTEINTGTRVGRERRWMEGFLWKVGDQSLVNYRVMYYVCQFRTSVKWDLLYVGGYAAGVPQHISPHQHLKHNSFEEDLKCPFVVYRAFYFFLLPPRIAA